MATPAPPGEDRPSDLTVVIPSRDRLADVRVVIGSLRTASPPDVRVRVIIVDDHPDRPYAGEHFGKNEDRFTIEVLPGGGRGLNAGRNLGIARSNSEVIGLLDDDVVVDDGWVVAMLNAFGDPDLGGVAGRILVQYEAESPEWLHGRTFEGYLSICDHGEDVVPAVLPTGANCGLRRSAWAEVGGFSEGVDRNGLSLVSGGETEFFQALARLGWRSDYVPEASVRHRFGADRLTLDYMQRRAFGQGVADEIIGDGTGAYPSELRGRLRATMLLARCVATDLMWRARARDPRRLMWRHYCRGRFDSAWHHAERREALRRLRSSERR